MPKERTFSPVINSDSGRVNKFAVPLVLPSFKNSRSNEHDSNREKLSSHATYIECDGEEAVHKHSQTNASLQTDSDYILIDAGLIDQNAFPPRTFYLDENIKQIADSMLESGQRDAIHVIPNNGRPGRYIIGDGWTRVLATRSYNINDNKVLAKVHHDLTEEEASWLGYSQNKDRTPPTDLDLATYYKKWFDNGTAWDDIANRAGISKSLMSYFASFHKLDTEILSLIKAAPQRFTANAAYHLSRLQLQAGSEAALSMANRFLLDEQSVRQLKAQVDDALDRAGRKKNVRGNDNKVMLQRAFPGGHFRQRKNGLVEMSATVPEERINYFNSKLEELLKEVLLSSDTAQEGERPIKETSETLKD